MKKIILLICLGTLLMAEQPQPFKAKAVQPTQPFTGKIMQLQQKLDPMFGIPLDKYPKWHAEALLKNGHKAEFISVKSMMQVYLHQEYFLKRNLLEDKIDKIYVKDYLTGEKADAKEAVYVFGSRIVGPHGDDLIPFASETNAKLFMMKNGGTKLLPYSKITAGLLRYLDM
ncbi:MAG: hypothetical protein P794_07055 [Epsilonproteobacteria bacterium (ex Lamellibrachia satsuma)]|nr:MAG: hypothetical protein P794_07055 [Epsilonproteobacteria bacterium (ex Lamellibrachia satsuma)]